MAALDVAVQPAMRQLLRRVLAERTAIIVTHDDRITHYADRTVHISDGNIEDAGVAEDRPAEVAEPDDQRAKDRRARD